MGINKKSIMFDINKYNKIMSHIDEYEDKDIKVTSLTDADIFDKIKDGGYSYELNDEIKVLEKLRMISCSLRWQQSHLWQTTLTKLAVASL